MRVNVPFLYPAVVVEDEEQVQTFEGDWTELEIHDASDAPLVCSMEGFTIEGMPYEIEVRKVGDRFYRPKVSISGKTYAPIDDGSDRVTTHNLGMIVPTYHFGNGNGQDAFPDRLDQIVRFIDRPDRPVLAWDGRADALVALEHATRDLVVVDGQIWEPCGEPRLSVNLFWSPAIASVVFVGPEARSPNGYECLFPVDQVDGIRAMVEEASMDPRMLHGQQQRPGRTVAEARNPWTITDVAIPAVPFVDASLMTDPTRDAIISAKTGLADVLARTPLERFTMPLILAWVQFRDAVEAAEDNPDESRMEALFEAWGLANEAIGREPPPRHGVIGEAPAERLRSRYEMAAYRDHWRSWAAGQAITWAQIRQPQLR